MVVVVGEDGELETNSDVRDILCDVGSRAPIHGLPLPSS